MTFAQKLKEGRKEAGLTQSELAKKIGVSLRTVAGWETNGRFPKTRDMYKKVADVLGISANYLMTDDEEFLIEAREKYGDRGAEQAQRITNEVTGLFAGGDLGDDDLDNMMRAIQDAYWVAKEKNKKYTPKKYLKKK